VSGSHILGSRGGNFLGGIYAGFSLSKREIASNRQLLSSDVEIQRVGKRAVVREFEGNALN